ncbi:stage II sporulation protein M [Chloroflexota bacterium]
MLNKLKPALVVTRREVRDQLRDWRIIAPIFALTLVFPAIMNFAAERMVRFVVRFGAELIAERLIPFLLMVVGFFPISVSLVIALESFVGEKERRSIEPLLISPLSDWQLYLGKLIAVMLPPIFASYLGIVVYLVGVYRELGWVAPLELLIQIVVLTLVQALVMVSGAVVISTQTTSVRAANLLASFIIIPMAFLIQGEAMVMFWAQYDTLWWAVGGLIVIAVLLIRTGVSHFNREELLGRELDVLNLKWMWKTFIQALVGKATSLSSWIKLEIGGAFKPIRLPFLLMFLALIASFWVGGAQAEVFQIPTEIIKIDEIDPAVIEGFERYSLFSTQGVALIFLHNLRAILIGALLGLFTYGVFGILVALLPFMLIGYVMATLANAGVPAWEFIVAFVLPHGIFEIPAILLSGAAIFRLGAALAGPARSGESIGTGLLQALADWAKIMVGYVVPLLLAAALMEALVTPKIAVWLLTR